MVKLKQDRKPAIAFTLVDQEVPDLPRFSASQTKKALDCLASWWFDRRTERGDDTRAQLLGVETHARLEARIKGDDLKPDDVAQDDRCAALDAEGLARADVLAEAVRPHFPTGPLVEAEWEFYLVVSIAGKPVLQLLGYVDCTLADPKFPKVMDLKTTSNFKYTLSPEALGSDVQGLIYAQAVLTRFPEALDVVLQWVYVHTRNKNKIVGPKPMVTVSRSFVELGMRALWDTIWQDMIRASSRKTAPKGSAPDACDKWGGCAFSSIAGGPCTQIKDVGHAVILRKAHRSA